jgi:hypothetical protein
MTYQVLLPQESLPDAAKLNVGHIFNIKDRSISQLVPGTTESTDPLREQFLIDVTKADKQRCQQPEKLLTASFTAAIERRGGRGLAGPVDGR